MLKTRKTMTATRWTLAAALLIGLVGLGTVAATAAPSTYSVDKSHSALMFRIKHLNVGYTYGRFNEFSGTFVVDEKNPAASSVQLEVDIASVDTNDEKRDGHLKSPDFFNVNQFPKMTFKSTSISKTADGAFAVQGDLTLHGKTNAVTLTLKKTGEGDDPWGNHRIGFEGTTSFSRKAFGMDKMPEAVADKVWVTVSVEGIRK